MALSERSKFAKKVASKLEELTAHKLRNSTSHYEFEIRMIEGKSWGLLFISEIKYDR